MILAIAIAVSCVAIAIAVYSIEQLLDASARSEALKRIDDVPPLHRRAPAWRRRAAAASARPRAPRPARSPRQPLRRRGPLGSQPTPAPSEADIDAQKLSALEAEMRQRARETAEQAAVEAARRKERAWQRFYQRPDFCADNPTAAQMVQCANHHIRARKEFEERYGTGRL